LCMLRPICEALRANSLCCCTACFAAACEADMGLSAATPACFCSLAVMALKSAVLSRRDCPIAMPLLPMLSV
jgi:hypothetical protein